MRGADAASRSIASVADVRRDRLFALLDEGRQRRLTLVVAPAGYGKTTLLSQWVASGAEDPVAWCRLRPEHNRAEELSALLGAVRRSQPSTLVLDDFQQLTDPRCVDDCASFIEQAPETLHVFVASRVDPPPRYYRLRLMDALTEVRHGDLAFTREEAVELTDASDELMARTEGWARGLASLGDEQAIDAYLTTEVLDAQSEEVRQFLIKASVLERMSGPLCDHLTSGHGSQAILEDLESGGAFVFAAGAGRVWFRAHPLFRALLRRHLRTDGGRVERKLLHSAAEWHLMHGELEDGIKYLIEAGAGDEVIEAAFTHGAAMFERHDVDAVAGWMQQVQSSPEHARASATLLEAAALLSSNRSSGVQHMLDDVRAMPAASSGELLIDELLRAYLALDDGSKVAVRAANRVLRTVGALDEAELPNIFGLTGCRADVAAGAHVARGVARMYEGQLVAARRDLEAVGEEVHGLWRATALGSLGLVEAWSGNLGRGEELATRSLSLADSLGHDPASRTTAWLALALVARHRNDLERASSLLDDVELAGGGRRRVIATWVATERALLLLSTDIPAAGLATLAGPLASAHPSLPSGILARRVAAEAQIRIASDDLESAAEILEFALGAGESDLIATRVRVAVERGDTSGARRLVDKWPDEPQARVRRERLLWTAILDHLDGDEARSRSEMAEVVAEADADGDVALFQAAGKFALGPARALYRAAPTVFLRALVDQPFIAGQVKPAKGLAEQLTDREYMVLVHLPSRQSNAEIAKRLGVSLNTVKTHLKHIYRKLDVVGRSDAVEAAEHLHLL